MKSPKFTGSIGSQIIIAQEQYRHKQRLDHIYNKKQTLSRMTVNQDYLMISSYRNPLKMSKKAFNDEMNHHLTIKHLIKRLNSPKTFNQRLKDTNDFLSYPALFFRNNKNEAQFKKRVKTKNNYTNPLTSGKISRQHKDQSKIHASDNYQSSKAKQFGKKIKNSKNKALKSQSVNSQMPHNGLTAEKVSQQLPQLQKFQQEDIQKFADHLTRIIFKYNLNTMDDIEYLFECVEAHIPEEYPQNFVNAIEDMFKQIVNSLNIDK